MNFVNNCWNDWMNWNPIFTHPAPGVNEKHKSGLIPRIHQYYEVPGYPGLVFSVSSLIPAGEPAEC